MKCLEKFHDLYLLILAHRLGKIYSSTENEYQKNHMGFQSLKIKYGTIEIFFARLFHQAQTSFFLRVTI